MCVSFHSIWPVLKKIITSVISVTTSRSTSNILLLSMYHTIIHCFLFINFFVTYLSKADYVHPYIAFKTSMYNTCRTFLYNNFFLCFGFISHMILTKSPVNFSNTLSLFSLAAKSDCKYSPGMLKIATSISLCTSISNNMKRDSIEAVGEVADVSSLIFLCLLPLAHVRPLMSPSHYFLSRLTVSRALSFSSVVRLVTVPLFFD